ncbi:hypothetical protein DQ04_01371130 [Trypanosoma grayi]|uniref:hypothetical protein n=1 Tax=Trypanosoma grayi TaxID=71804 RepID=UPI0004F47432|nr:hypothetical protein DQ04_01371130 [Trypanosoma grayi]KEG12866.1 hypothetical protein DQ04_01371130 [Trypanosoma grayi]
MSSGPGVAVQALKRLLRATGVDPGNAFFSRRLTTSTTTSSSTSSPLNRGLGDAGAWCNYSVSARDTLATCELETEDYFGPHSPALICVRVRAATPGCSFPTSCVMSLSTSSQRMDELAVQDVIVKEWIMNPASCLDPEWMETTLSVKTVYHIACLLGKEPACGTRIFLTLRFVGCCDTSNTHRIAAVELLYTSLRQLIPPAPVVAPKQLQVAADNNNADAEPVEVELTLSPTPLRSTAEDCGYEVACVRASGSLPEAQYPVEKTIIVDNEMSPGDGPDPAVLRPTFVQAQCCSSCSGASSPMDDDIEPRDDSEDCVLAAYGIHTTTPSPPRRSVTQPRRTLYADAEDEVASDDVIELPTSPCKTLSRSPSLNRMHSTSGLWRDDDNCAPLSPAPIVVHNRQRWEWERAPRREAPTLPRSSRGENVVSVSSTRESSCHVQTMDDAGCASAPVHESASLLRPAPFVVPDRRDFVSVTLLQHRHHHQQQSQQETCMRWGEQRIHPTCTPVIATGKATVVENRRRIKNLCDVPVYEEKHDLLKTVTELLGVERESLCRRSLSCPSLSAARGLSSTRASINSRRQSPSPMSTREADEHPLQRLVGCEVKEPTSTVVESTVAPNAEKTPQLQDTLQGPADPPVKPAASLNRMWRVPRQKSVLAHELKTTKVTPEENSSVSDEPPAVETTCFPKSVKEHRAKRRPLTDRTSEINLYCCSKDARNSGPRLPPQGGQLALERGVLLPCDTSIPSSEDSDGPALVVQVEQPVPPQTSMWWGESVSVYPTPGPSESAVRSPFIGTFLVWKHHVSRSGTAKRILSLQRDGDSAVVSLKKLDRNKTPSLVTLREKVEVITGLRAYYSNAIHRDNVHVAECCLVVTSEGKQVTAVEMQSVSELHLAVQILLPICEVNST